MRGRKKSEVTRDAILRCASEVFTQKPFHEVLIDDISTRMRMGKGTLYRYFSSKEELYFATIVEGLHGMHEAVREVMQQETPLERTIETLARTIIGYFWKRRDFFVLLHRHEPKLDPGQRAEWQRNREEFVGMVQQPLTRELRRRGATAITPRLAVEMLFGMLRSVCLYRNENDRADDLARQVTTVFLSGILPAPGTARTSPAAGRRRPPTRRGTP